MGEFNGGSVMTVTSPRQSSRWFSKPPASWPDVNEWLTSIAASVRNIMDGKINTVGSVTLTASVASTTITDSRIGPNSAVTLTATTANAAAALATTYVTAGEGSAVITHANAVSTDRTFKYVILG